jgi:hypothetical protein
MSWWLSGEQVRCMASYLLHHRHGPRECGVVLAAFKGPGRAQQTLDHTEVTRVESNRLPR